MKNRRLIRFLKPISVCCPRNTQVHWFKDHLKSLSLAPPVDIGAICLKNLCRKTAAVCLSSQQKQPKRARSLFPTKVSFSAKGSSEIKPWRIQPWVSCTPLLKSYTLTQISFLGESWNNPNQLQTSKHNTTGGDKGKYRWLHSKYQGCTQEQSQQECWGSSNPSTWDWNRKILSSQIVWTIPGQPQLQRQTLSQNENIKAPWGNITGLLK